MNKLLYFVISFTLLLSACKNDVTTKNMNNFTVSGVVENIPQNTYISLINRTHNNVITLDSVLMIDSTFKLSAEISGDKNFYLLKLTNNNYYVYLLADSGDNIKVKADFMQLQNYEVTNSDDSKLIQYLENRLYQTNTLIDKGFKNNVSESEIEKIKDNQKDFSLDFINKNNKSIASIIALSERFLTGEPVLPIEKYYDVHKQTEKNLKEKYNSSDYYLMFCNFIKNYEINLNRQNKIPNEDYETPAKLVNFVAKTIDGQNFELQNLSGEWILLNFWASWSWACVENNILLKKITKNKTDLNIVQISIDKYEKIAVDTLKKYDFKHILINDSTGWKSDIINLYNVNGLPTNILINPKGEIVLFSQSPAELNQKLNSTFR